MLRTLLTLFTIACLEFPVLHAAGQPGTQPSSGLNPVPETHVYPGGRSYLGVDIRDITQDRLAPLKLKEERGVEITMVDRDAPAGKAGLREHDVILDFNGTPVESEEQLRRLIRETPPGRTVALGISRDGGAPMKVTVRLAEHSKVIGKNHITAIPPIPPLPEMPDLSNRFDVPGNIYVVHNSSAILGVQTENLTSQLGDFFGVKNGEGVLVRSVEKGSPAEKGGLKAGDVIVRIGDEKLSDRSDFSRVMRKYRSGGKLNLGVVRDKHEQTFSVDLPQRGTKDSSGNYIDLDGIRGLLDDIKPEVESFVESSREMAKLNKSELDRAIRQYSQAMHQYKDQFKDLQKELQEQREEIERNLHRML